MQFEVEVASKVWAINLHIGTTEGSWRLRCTTRTRQPNLHIRTTAHPRARETAHRKAGTDDPVTRHLDDSNCKCSKRKDLNNSKCNSSKRKGLTNSNCKCSKHKDLNTSGAYGFRLRAYRQTCQLSGT